MKALFGWLDDHKTKIAGIIVTAIGSLQANAGVLETLLTEKQFAIFTIVAGLIVTVIGSTNTARQKARTRGEL